MFKNKRQENKKLSGLSVFFPAYNEEGNIKAMVKQALSIVPELACKYEVIVVDDGSQDKTYQIATNLAKKFKNVRVVTQENKGYGGAVKRGFKEAKFEWVFFTDADRQFDLGELEKFVPYALKRDSVIGYRTNRAEGIKRKLLADALKIWNRVFLGFPTEIRDIDCAFKLIHKSVLCQALPLKSNGAMITTELLLKAHQQGFKFKQVGVKHYSRQVGESTGNNPNVILKAVKDTFMLRKYIVTDNFWFKLKKTIKKNLQLPWLKTIDVVQ